MKKNLVIAVMILTAINTFAQKNDDAEMLNHFMKGHNYLSIHLSKYPTGHLYAEGKVNGIKGRFILDTGAGATIVESTKKDKFNMKVEADTIKATGAGGTGLEVQSSDGNVFELVAGHAQKNFTFKLLSLEHINGALRSLQLEEIDGIIGADFLSGRSAVIDYKNMILYFKK